MLFMHDHKHKRIPRSFYDVWRTIEENNIQYPVLNRFDYRINQARICLTERLPICTLPKVWNLYSFEQTKNIISKEAFKLNVKKNLLESIDVICKRLLCPICHLSL